jgi:hypothetical protein
VITIPFGAARHRGALYLHSSAPPLDERTYRQTQVTGQLYLSLTIAKACAASERDWHLPFK